MNQITLAIIILTLIVGGNVLVFALALQVYFWWGFLMGALGSTALSILLSIAVWKVANPIGSKVTTPTIQPEHPTSMFGTRR